MDRLIQIGEETLEIDDAGTAVYAIGNTIDLDLPGMAGRAIHANFLAIASGGDGKADRRAGFPRWADNHSGRGLPP
jgi:hypothetical protein